MTQPIVLPSKSGRWWVKVGKALGFRVVAPADVEFAPGRWVHADALLPDIGGRHGMLLATDFSRIEEFARDPASEGYGFSTLGEPDRLEITEADLDRVIELLDDWTWTGDPAAEPEWLKRPPLSAPSNLGLEWIALGDALKFEVIAPAQVRLGARVVEVDVQLPEFGSPYGILLMTDYSRIEALADRLLDVGYSFTTLEDPDTQDLTEEKLASAIRLLQDWGGRGSLRTSPNGWA